MNPITRFFTAALLAITALIGGALMSGPTDAEAAQDVADDLAAVVSQGVKP